MAQYSTDTIKSIIEIGTAMMLVFSTCVIVIVYVLHGRLVKQRIKG